MSTNKCATYMLQNYAKLLKRRKSFKLSTQDWEDVVAKVFENVLRLNPEVENAAAYITTALSQQSYNFSRAHYVKLRFQSTDLDYDYTKTLKSQDYRADYSALHKAIKDLPAKRAEVAKLLLQGYTYEEIALTTNTRYNTAKAHARLAYSELARKFKDSNIGYFDIGEY